MHQDDFTHTTTVWKSDVRREVQTTDPALAEVIAWADAHPCAWDVVCQTKSKAFGRTSCDYIEWAQYSMYPEAILERARHLHGLATGCDASQGPASIFAWRARFTLEHYHSKRFTGGLLCQHDGKFHRRCLSMDYTPETLGFVVSRFIEWCGRDLPTAYVVLDYEIMCRIEPSQ